jgi:hypothetical protein
MNSKLAVYVMLQAEEEGEIPSPPATGELEFLSSVGLSPRSK